MGLVQRQPRLQIPVQNRSKCPQAMIMQEATATKICAPSFSLKSTRLSIVALMAKCKFLKRVPHPSDDENWAIINAISKR